MTARRGARVGARERTSRELTKLDVRVVPVQEAGHRAGGGGGLGVEAAEAAADGRAAPRWPGRARLLRLIPAARQGALGATAAQRARPGGSEWERGGEPALAERAAGGGARRAPLHHHSCAPPLPQPRPAPPGPPRRPPTPGEHLLPVPRRPSVRAVVQADPVGAELGRRALLARLRPRVLRRPLHPAPSPRLRDSAHSRRPGTRTPPSAPSTHAHPAHPTRARSSPSSRR